MREPIDFQEAVKFLSDPDSTKNMSEYLDVYIWALETAQPFVKASIERCIGIDLAEAERMRMELELLTHEGEVH